MVEKWFVKTRTTVAVLPVKFIEQCNRITFAFSNILNLKPEIF